MPPRNTTPEPAACSVCTAPTGDDGLLCRTHTHELDTELRDVPDIVVELEVTITRQDRIAARQAGRSAERPLQWNEHAAEAASNLWTTLSAWALDVSRHGEDERDQLADVGKYDTAEIALWIARNMPVLRHHEEAGTAFDECVDAARAARRAIDRPPLATRFHAGPCPELIEAETAPGITDTVTCDGEVWAFVPIDPDTLAYLRCQGCGAKWDTTQWLRVGNRMRRRIDELRAARAS